MIITPKDFSRILTTALIGMPSRPITTESAMVRLQFDGSNLIVTCADSTLSVSARHQVPNEEEVFDLLVLPRDIKPFVEYATEPIVIRDNGQTLSFQSGQTSINVPTGETDDFAHLQMKEVGQHFTITRRHIKSLLVAANLSSALPHEHSISVTSQGNKVFCSTQSIRVTIVVLKGSSNISAMIPAVRLEKAIKATTTDETPSTKVFLENTAGDDSTRKVMLEQNNVRVIFSTTNAKPNNWAHYLDFEPKHTATFSHDDIVGALTAATAYSVEGTPTHIIYETGSSVLVAHGAYDFQSREIPTVAGSQFFKELFSAQYMLDAIKDLGAGAKFDFVQHPTQEDSLWARIHKDNTHHIFMPMTV